MAGGTPDDFINKVRNEGVKVRGIKGSAYVKEGSNLIYLRGKIPGIIEGTCNKICKISEIVLLEPITHTHGVRKRIKLEGCGEEIFNPENFKITI